MIQPYIYICSACDHIKKLLQKPEDLVIIYCELCEREANTKVRMDRFTAREFEFIQDDIPNNEKIRRKAVEWH